MTERHEIILIARNETEQAFRAISSGADRVADDLERIGREGGDAFDDLSREAKTADTALDRVGKSADDASRDMDELARSTDKSADAQRKSGDAARNWGAALGTAGAALAVVGRASVQQEREINALERVYGDAAASLLEWSDAMQENTNFSNESARQAALNAATLAQNYDFTTEQIQLLIERTADLATTQGMDLNDAIQRTQSAMRGEAESAEALGLTLNDARVATYAAEQGITDYSTGLTDAEKAQVRFTYFLEQSASATGAAAEAHDSARGFVLGLANSLQDAAVSAGGAIGPIGEVASVGAELAIAMPLAGAGIAKIAPLMRSAAIGAAGLTAAMGPVGLTLVAIGAGLAIAEATGLINIFGDDAKAASNEIVDLSSAFDDLAISAGSNLDALADIRAIEDMIEALDTVATAASQIASNGEISGAIASELAVLQTQFGLTGDAWEDFLGQIAAGEITVDQFAGIASDVSELLSNQAVDVNVLEGELSSLFAQWSSGAITIGDLQKRIAVLTNNYYDLTQAGLAEAAATTENTMAAADNESAKQKQIERGKALDEALQAEKDATEEATEAAAELASTYRDALVPSIDGLEGALKNAVPAGHDMLDVLRELADAGQIDISGEGTIGWINQLDQSARAMEYAQVSWLEMVSAIEDSGAALDSIVGLYGTIDELGARMSAAEGIASTLFGPDGNAFDGIGPLADLLNEGRIAQDAFNAAVEAGLTIQSQDAEVQSNLNAIRANLLPILAEQALVYSDHIEGLSRLTAEEQAHALAMMDSGNQAKVATAYSTAYSASLGEIPEDVATDIIANAARADPVIADLLEEFGLIEKGANGDIRVNFPNGDSVVSVTRSLTDSINVLIETLGGVPPEVTTMVTAKGAEETKQTLADVTGIAIAADGQSMRIIVAETGAEETKGHVADVEQILSDLDGASASAIVNADTATADQQLLATNQGVTWFDGREVVTTVRVDVANRADEFMGQLGEGGGAEQTIAIGVSLDRAAFDTAMAGIRGELAMFALTTTSASLSADTTSATTAIGEVNQLALNWDVRTSTATLDLDIEPWRLGYNTGIDAMAVWAAYTATSTMDVDIEPWRLGYNTGIDAMAVWAAYTATSTLAADSFPFDATMGSANSAGNSFAGTTYTASLAANDSSFWSTVGAISGSTVGTAYINVVGQQTGPLSPYRDGGIVGYADGGIVGAANGRVVMVGEAGPELATLPVGTRITPNPASMATPGIGGGDTYNFYGDIYGMDDFESRVAEVATRKIVPAFQRGIAQHKRSMGLGGRS